MIRVSNDEDCPTTDYVVGEAQGKCWGDGHYLCNHCVFFRADFKKNIDLRDKLLAEQGGIKYSILLANGAEKKWN